MFTSMTRGIAQRPMRKAAFMAGLLAASLALTACGGGATNASPTTSSGSETSTSAGETDPNAIIEAGFSYALSGGFDPMVTTGAITVAANWHTLEGLTELDPTTRAVYAALGAELPTKVDDTTYTVKLRDGAVFHNGDPVTVEDVIYSFERVMDPASESLYAGFIDFIESVTKVDDTTVQIKTKYAFSLVAERLSVVKIVPKAVVEADYDAFNSLPIGTGPYKITYAQPDDKITFERFDDYTGSRPAQAAGMNWNLLSDSAARVTALQSGTVSAIESVPYIDMPTLEQNFSVESTQSFGLLFMMFNTQKAPFDDVRVRQAFFYALDMNKIIETGLLGNAEAATSFLPENHPNYHEASTQYSYDPEKAKALLKEAGIEDGFKVNLKTTDTDWVQVIAPLLKEDLDAVGLDITLDIAQSGAQYAKVDAGELDVMVAPGDPSVFGNDPDLLMRWWYDDNVWAQARHRWSGPAFDEMQELLDTAVKQSGDEQEATWDSALDLISDEVPLYPLLHRKLPTAWSTDELTGFTPIGLTGLSFLDTGVIKK